MNWGRAKTILIVLFLALDAFLLIVLIHSRMLSGYISEETVHQTARILKEHNIQVAVNEIPNKRLKNQNLIMENILSSPETAAKKILGKHYKTQFSDSAQHTYIFENEKAILRVKDSSFTYVLKEQEKNNEKTPALQREEIDRLVIKELGSMGFGEDSLRLFSCEPEGEYFIYKVIPLYKGSEIHGVTMHIQADALGILTIAGNWFQAVETENRGEALLDVTAVLTDLIYQPAFSGMKIKHVKNGFWVSGEYVKGRRIAAVPVYIVTTETGMYYFDAQTGEQIEK